jgi:hypothetical protein
MKRQLGIGIGLIAVVLIAVGVWYFTSSGHGMPGSAATTTTAAVTTNDTVATVNGTPIMRNKLVATEAQITTQLGVTASTSAQQAQLQTQALDSLIGQVLLSQAASAAGITASSTLVDAQIQAAKTQLGSDTAYQQALAAQGMTEADLRTQIASGLAINTYLEQQLKLSAITATDAEITAAYKQVAAAQTGVPPLAQVKAQVKQSVIQQKQQVLINAQVQKLRATADVKILI